MAKAIRAMPRQQHDSKSREQTKRQEEVLRALSGFREIIGTTKRHLQAVQAECGLSGAQLWALSQIAQQPGMTVGQLARLLFIHQSTASNLLRVLEGRKLIVLERRSLDQRVARLVLTDAGTEVLQSAPAPARGVLPEAIDQLSSKELRQLNLILSLVLRHLRARDRSAARRPLSDLIA